MYPVLSQILLKKITGILHIGVRVKLKLIFFTLDANLTSIKLYINQGRKITHILPTAIVVVLCAFAVVPFAKTQYFLHRSAPISLWLRAL